MRKLIFALLLLPVLSFAQGTSTNIRNGSNLPTACANGDIFYKTTSPIGVHECSVPGNPGTWRRIYQAASAVVCGSDTQIQFNDGGGCGSDSNFVWDKTGHTLGIGGSSRGYIDILGTTGAPSNPAANKCRYYFDTTTGKAGWINSSGGSCGPATGTGTVTHTGGALTSGSLMVGAGTDDSAVLGSDPTNCSTGQAPTGIDKTGAAKGCASIGGSSSGLVLVEQHTASSSATLDFTTCISSTYDDYVIKFVNIIPATNSVDWWMRMSTNGGSSYDTGSNYSWTQGSDHAGSADSSAGTGAAFIQMGNSYNTTASWSLNGSVEFFAPGSSIFKVVDGHGNGLNASTRFFWRWHGVYEVTTAVNAFRFMFSSGNIASGTIRCYGVAK